MTDEPTRGRTADLPLEDRRRSEVERQCELDEGLTRRHVADSQYQRRYLAVQLANALRVGPALAAKLRGE
jgi:hypothetical protein